ncbi:hypothetical protein AN642_00725 [Epulopiscium sp. SCG-B10WGA-EpuloA2]|nr:hypothetical protein AN642_00725 [Epulopiscium sp. SCG-B10WGA-EpuloA2]
MIQKRFFNNVIYNEFSEDLRKDYFDLIGSKVIKSIDSLYVSIHFDKYVSYDDDKERKNFITNSIHFVPYLENFKQSAELRVYYCRV